MIILALSILPKAINIAKIHLKDKISKINDEIAEAMYFKNGDKVTLYIFIESIIGLKCVSELSSKYIVSIKTSSYNNVVVNK